MNRTVYEIPKMDCPSEENLIRLKLQAVHDVRKLEFDIPSRRLKIFHEGGNQTITALLEELNLGSTLIESVETDDFVIHDQSNERKLLWAVLGINFAFFVLEIVTGLISDSMGLVADSLDMLADSFVYGLSLFAVGGTMSRKKKIATTAGYFQMILALIGLIEVLRRFTANGEVPDFSTMIVVSIFALTANAICLYILRKSDSGEAHIRASMIFTSNDVIINLGVIAAGVFVLLLESNLPDLIVGGIVFILVVRGALRILKLGN